MVLIYNRMDCCQNRINNAEVWADNTMCGRVMYEANKQTYSVACNGVKAKEVSVKLSTGDYLSLAEVQVFGKHGRLQFSTGIRYCDFISVQKIRPLNYLKLV